MNFLINIATDMFFNFFIGFSHPSTPTVHGDEQQPVGLQAVLEEHAWSDGVLCAHGNVSTRLDDGVNNVMAERFLSHNVIGLVAAVESGVGNGVRVQAALPEPPPFPVHRMVGNFRARRLASRRQLPKFPRLVVH